ncbi:MAG: hypothetical protein EOO11_20165 [Chitinophagaceae bacterium]|nr:MAG: hypothetical protein EOO11_20165 [Chitinophagaceae bacterium]
MRATNKLLLSILAGAVAIEVFTGVYFVPRIFIIFLEPLSGVSDETLATASRQWQVANYIRFAMVLGTLYLYGRTAYRLVAARVLAARGEAPVRTETSVRTVATEALR